MLDWLANDRIVLGIPDRIWLDQVTRLCQLLPAAQGLPDIPCRILEREQLGSTEIGHGVAVPHCQVEGMTGAQVAAGTIGQERIMFVILAADSGSHLQALAHIAIACHDAARVRKACLAQNPNDFRLALSGDA